MATASSWRRIGGRAAASGAGGWAAAAGTGAAVVIEAAGTPDSIATAFQCAARGARVVIVGSGRTLDRSANWVGALQGKDLRVIGAHLTALADREASATRWSY